MRAGSPEGCCEKVNDQREGREPGQARSSNNAARWWGAGGALVGGAHLEAIPIGVERVRVARHRLRAGGVAHGTAGGAADDRVRADFDGSGVRWEGGGLEAQRVAGAARDHLEMLIFGLVLSIALMALTANYIAKLLEKHTWLGYLGLAIIAYVAIQMIWQGSGEVMDVINTTT